MKLFLIPTAAVVAAVVVLVSVTVTSRHLVLTATSDGTIPGILHVHTNRSDGLSGPDEVAAAAARSGLKFLVFTDHGDATRTPDPPRYRSGVLCLDAVEISTTGGHYIALDLPAAPYPLAGEPRDVVEDVKRLGGFGVAAHPDSPKSELRWREWTAPFDAIELLNLDTSWRILAQQSGWSPKWRLFEALVAYPFRPPEAVAGLIHPPSALDHWEALTRRRRVVVAAGADAHAKLALWKADPGDSRYALPLPGYETLFRVMSVRIQPDRALSGNATEDAAVVVRAIRAGHLYTVVDGVASPPAFDFTATNEHGTVHQGDDLGVGGQVLLHVRSNAPPEFTTIVHEGTRTLTTLRDARDLTVHASDRPAVYWVEIVSTGRRRPVTWVRSNPIYVRGAEGSARLPVRPPATDSTPLFDGRTAAGWREEHDQASLSAVDIAPRVGGAALRLQYSLSGGSAAGQYAGLVYTTPNGTAPYDRLTFTIHAEHPMRVSVQLRWANRDNKPEWWQRSVYVDAFDQERTVYFDDLMPIGTTETRKPPFDQVRSILFVVDTMNTKPGSSGQLWITSVALQR